MQDWLLADFKLSEAYLPFDLLDTQNLQVLWPISCVAQRESTACSQMHSQQPPHNKDLIEQGKHLLL